MSRYCPIKNGPALYLDCLECDTKECKEKPEGKKDGVEVKESDVK